MTIFLLFFEFFKIGLFCFGGAFGMIPLVREVVLSHEWLTEAEFYDFIGVCESTPGPIAVNMATYVGSTQCGIPGAVAATVGVILPSFIIILIIAAALRHLTDNEYFKGFIRGVRPVVAALIISTGLSLLAKTLGFSGGDPGVDVVSAVIFALLAALWFGCERAGKKLSAPVLIIASAALGVAVNAAAHAVGL